MIVYGDPSYDAPVGVLLARLKERRAQAARHAVPSLDSLRTLLIQAGQLEQAAEDGLPALVSPSAAEGVLQRLRAATDSAASAFCTSAPAFGSCPAAGAVPRAEATVPASLERMECALDGIEAPRQLRLTVKIPEGFAYYALYPEQYWVSARRWMADHLRLSAGRGAVIGIRSIGTTLSAVVAECLRAEGWPVRRLTVRPTGEPFARSVEIRPAVLDGVGWALVVDEGPGQSGSSMAATAEALWRAGIAPGGISFLPSHAGGPGGASSERVRHWWATTPVYATVLADLRWEGAALPELLALRSRELLGTGESLPPAEDVGGGMWRRVAYRDVEHWPAVCTPFERTKYRCTAQSGVSVLWKFAGLAGVDDSGMSAAERSLGLLAGRAAAGWTAAPLGLGLGFVATPWIEGAPLTAADGDATVLASVGRYLAAVSGPPLSLPEQEAARARLAEMLYWNTWELLGEATAARARPWSDMAAGQADGSSVPSYGDGRPAPHEWLRLPDGRVLKFDSTGHDTDHTAIGRQPLIWDIAGAMVEWGLDTAPSYDTRSAGPVLAAVRDTIGLEYPTSLLRFYRMAYAAFRAGQCTLCAGMSGHDPEEQARLSRAAAGYQSLLARLLATEL